jgi:CRP/FNR family transcriptional regulator
MSTFAAGSLGVGALGGGAPFCEVGVGGRRLRARGLAARLYSRGELIFSPGAERQSVYLLECGLVRIFRLSASGAETTFYYVSPGEVFGAESLLAGDSEENFAQALSPSRAWKVPRADFEEALGRDASVLREVARQLGRRLKLAENRLEDRVFRDVEARVARVLLELAERFGSSAEAGWMRLDLPVTQSDLATLVGTTRQSVNTSLRRLGAAGLLTREGRRVLRILPAALRGVANATLG